MKWITQLFFYSLTLSLFSLTAFAQSENQNSQPTDWQEFLVREANFRVELPGKPTHEEQAVKTKLGEIKRHLYSLEAEPVYYIIAHTDFPVAIDSPESAKAIFDNIRDSFAGSTQGTLKSEKEVTCGPYPGREIVLQGPEVTCQMRVYLIQNRLYGLIAVVPDETEQAELAQENTRRFWDSFELLEEPVAPEVLSTTNAEFKAPPEGFFDRPAVWQTLSVPELGFQVSIPSQPYKQVFTPSSDVPQMKVNLWMSMAGELGVMMMHMNLPEPFKNGAETKSLLQGLMSGLTESGEFTIIGETPISLNGKVGRQYKIKADNGVIGTCKAFVVGENIYALIAFSADSKTNLQGRNRILASFKLTPISEKTQ